MSGEQFREIDKPYLRFWQQRMAVEEFARSIRARRKRDRLSDPKPAKVKPAKPRKKGKKAKVRK